MDEQYDERPFNSKSEVAVTPGGKRGLSAAVKYHLEIYFSALDGSVPAGGLYSRILFEVEKPLIELTLKATRGNQVQAARLLGINRNTLRKKIHKLQISVTRSSK